MSSEMWDVLRQQAAQQSQIDPLLADFFDRCILRQNSMESAIAYILAHKLQTDFLPFATLFDLIQECFQRQPSQVSALCADLDAILKRDGACTAAYQPFCFYKGFHALAAYRCMHALWHSQRQILALQLQQRISMVFGVDIHPAARIGKGIMLDHATGIVIGETAVIGNHVSIMQGVTLGGTGKESGDRHPKIRDGVLISVGATVLGNIEVGEGAQIAAGSVVLRPVPAHSVAAGVPAEITGKANSPAPALTMDHRL